jgi:phosphocarrier protein HPr
MAKKQLTVDFKIGIHSRPAALIVKKAREYPNNTISFSHKEKSAAADSLIGLLTLGIVNGSCICIRVEGENDEAVLEKIVEYFTCVVALEG